MKKILVLGSLLLALTGCGNDMVKVGDLRYSHTTYTEEVYIVVRENGDEAYVLESNVEWCLEQYKERGTYGKLVPQGKRI